MMFVGAGFVLLYTILGGFLAESASDFMQSIVMIVADCHCYDLHREGRRTRSCHTER